MPKSFLAISCASVELKSNVSEICTISIVRVDVDVPSTLTMEKDEITETLVFNSTLAVPPQIYRIFSNIIQTGAIEAMLDIGA
jgi:hypothetical protein